MSHADLSLPTVPSVNAVITGIGEPTPVKGVVRKIKGGYGFIAGYDGKDYFMHWTAMQKKESKDFRQLAVGDRVEFTAIQSDRGPRAVEVLVIG